MARLKACDISVIFITTILGTHCRNPNIIIMVADDLGIGDVGCFGNMTIKTPNIDYIAENGVKLTHHLAAASVCTPSRAALLTGRYPIRSGMVPTHVVRVNMFVSSSSGLPSSEVTIAEVLKQQDYAAGFIGKWHLGLSCSWRSDFCFHPLNQGFDYYYGLPLTNLKDFGDDGDSVVFTKVPHLDNIIYAIMAGAVLTSAVLMSNGLVGKRTVFFFLLIIFSLCLVTMFICKNLKMLNSIIMRNYDVAEQPIDLNDNLTQKLVIEGVEYMEKQVQLNKPFLLIMSWVQVHTALHTSKEFVGHSVHGRYGDNIEEMDWSVGEIIKAVKNLGIAEDTLIYFTSDNGGHIDEYGLDGSREGGYNGIYKGGKSMGSMDGGIRVPTVAMWPGVIPPGHVIPQPTSMMDVMPTVARLVGAELPDTKIDGHDLMPLLTNKTSKPSHRVLIHYCGKDIHAARYSPTGSNDVWKVIYASPKFLPGTQSCGYICDCYGDSVEWHDPPSLYNVATDPSEDHPVDHGTELYRNILTTVQHELQSHIASIEPVENQYSIINMLPRPWLQPCCNFPYCSCRDPRFTKSQS